MKQFIIFFAIVLTIYSLINFYIYKRGMQAFSEVESFRKILLVLFLLAVVAYPLGRILESIYVCKLNHTIVYLGSFYLAAMVYFFFSILLIDLLRSVNHFIPIFPSILRQNMQFSAQISGFIVLSITLIIVWAGHINALKPRIKKMKINIEKKAGDLESLKIVMASDIHLGTIIHNSRLLNIVEKINSLEPDIILFPGDIVDEDVRPVIQQNMAATLTQLKSKYGVYATTGNHEYFGNLRETVKYLQSAGLIFLQDESILIDSAFYLIGRKDLMATRVSGGRAQIDQITGDLDAAIPKILMDHQPYFLERAEQAGIDLQISGHTHHGQLFPFNLITNKIYEKSWGYLQKGTTHYYISSGVGTWGPPVRIGTTPEIVEINLQFIP